MALSYRDKKDRDARWANVLDRMEEVQTAMSSKGLQAMDVVIDFSEERMSFSDLYFVNGCGSAVFGDRIAVELDDGSEVMLNVMAASALEDIVDFLKAEDLGFRLDRLHVKLWHKAGLKIVFNDSSELKWSPPNVANSVGQLSDLVRREMEALMDRASDHAVNIAQSLVDKWDAEWPGHAFKLMAGNGMLTLSAELPDKGEVYIGDWPIEALEEIFPGLFEEFDDFETGMAEIDEPFADLSFGVIKATLPAPVNDRDMTPGF